MEATLKFELPEERDMHLCALHGVDAFCMLHAIDEKCRSVIKHSDLHEDAKKLAEEIRSELSEVSNPLMG